VGSEPSEFEFELVFEFEAKLSVEWDWIETMVDDSVVLLHVSVLLVDTGRPLLSALFFNCLAVCVAAVGSLIFFRAKCPRITIPLLCTCTLPLPCVLPCVLPAWVCVVVCVVVGNLPGPEARPGSSEPRKPTGELEEDDRGDASTVVEDGKSVVFGVDVDVVASWFAVGISKPCCVVLGVTNLPVRLFFFLVTFLVLRFFLDLRTLVVRRFEVASVALG